MNIITGNEDNGHGNDGEKSMNSLLVIGPCHTSNAVNLNWKPLVHPINRSSRVVDTDLRIIYHSPALPVRQSC